MDVLSIVLRFISTDYAWLNLFSNSFD